MDTATAGTGVHTRPESVPARGRILPLIQSLMHAVDLQSRIIALRVKLTVQQVAMYLALAAFAAAFAIFGLICLAVGFFQILATIVPTHWAWILDGTVHLAIAGALFLLASRAMRDKEAPVPSEPETP